MAKKLAELFNRYQPDEQYRDIFEEGIVENVRVSREQKIVEAEVRFQELKEKKRLYEIEEILKQSYALNFVRIFPKYDSKYFSERYIPEVLLETWHRGAMSRGFFTEYNLSIKDNKITLEIPFQNGGIGLLYSGKTPEVISEIINDEFSLKYEVEIVHDQNSMTDYSDIFRKKEQQYAEEINKASKIREEQIKAFEENLIASGWEEVVQEESYATSYVEPTEGISGTPTPSPTPIPTPAQEDTGLEALEKEKDDTLLGGNKNGITEVLPEESGTLSGSGTAPEGAGAEDGTGATGEISGTDNQTTVTEQKPENNKEVVEESKIEKGKTFVPCFDPKSGEYVIYDVADLVSKRVEKPVSMNEKVKRSGHMIDKYTPFSAEAFEENSDNRLGVMLFFATLTVIAGLVVILMIKQKSREDAEL